MITYCQQKGIQKPEGTKQELRDYSVIEVDGIASMTIKKALLDYIA
tara:strand:+ start:449 stop:586 length:138 start_codon:yes stop_codon:yes gene_type:complete